MANIRLIQDNVLNDNVRKNNGILSGIPNQNYFVIQPKNDKSNGTKLFDLTNPFVRAGMFHT